MDKVKASWIVSGLCLTLQRLLKLLESEAKKGLRDNLTKSDPPITQMGKVR